MSIDGPVFSGWRKSSRSGSAGDNCVEVAAADDGTVGVRDSEDPGGPILATAPSAWLDFLRLVTTGDTGC